MKPKITQRINFKYPPIISVIFSCPMMCIIIINRNTFFGQYFKLNWSSIFINYVNKPFCSLNVRNILLGKMGRQCFSGLLVCNTFYILCGCVLTSSSIVLLSCFFFATNRIEFNSRILNLWCDYIKLGPPPKCSLTTFSQFLNIF